MIANPWGFLALAAVPAILAIHLFRHRFRPHRLAGLFLWTSPGKDPTSGRRLHRLESTPSLILELLLDLALTAYLVDLRLGSTASGAEHLVAVLDASASMSAKGGGKDLAADARRKIESLVEQAGRRAQVTLVETGDPPILLAGPAAMPGQALEALDRWDPRKRSHPLLPALELSRELAGPGATVHVVTDRIPAGPEAGEPHLHWHALGSPLANAAILAARRERTEDPEADRLFLRIGAFGAADGPLRTLLTLRAGGRVLHEQSCALKGGAELRLSLAVPAGGLPVEAALSDDALAIDNKALLLRPPVRAVTCLLYHFPDCAERRALERALAALPEARLVQSATEAEEIHLIFAASNRKPAGLPDTWWCRFGPPQDAPAGDPADLAGPFLVEKGYPLLTGMDFGGILWRSPASAPPGLGGLLPLVSAGDRVLIGSYPAGDGLDLVINIDMARSNLSKTPDWPILIANLVRMRADDLAGSPRTNLRSGERLSLILPRDAAEAELAGPSGARRRIPGTRRVTLDLLEEPGPYQVLAAGRTLHEFAVNFQDPAESDLALAHTEEKAPPAEEKAAETRTAEALVDPAFHFPILAAALALFLANAFYVLRSRT